MRYYNVREKLISSTITVLAQGGFEKTTTKTIAKEVEIPEAYIYRYFSNKEELLKNAFVSLDCEFVCILTKQTGIMLAHEFDAESRSRLIFTSVWRFLLGNKEKCIAFIRYFYSPYYKLYSEHDHRERYTPLVKACREIFNPKANVWMLLNHILNVMLDFAIKVFDGIVPDNEDTAEHVFRLVYFSVSPYFRCNSHRKEKDAL